MLEEDSGGAGQIYREGEEALILGLQKDETDTRRIRGKNGGRKKSGEKEK